MVRKGWSAFPTPSGWYNVVRGPRPPSVQWPRRQPWGPQWSHPLPWPSVTKVKESRSEATLCRGIPTKCRRRHGLGSNDWRAVAVLGEGDSAEIRGLQAALKEARRAAQDCPLAAQVEEWLQHLQDEQVKEQLQLDTALARMARFRATTGPTVGPTGADPTLTQPGKIPELVAELDRLRARVAEMEIEREEVSKKRSRSLSVPSPDLVGGPDVSLQEWGAPRDQRVGQHQGALMETLICRGSTLAQSNRFSPLA